MVTLNTIRQTLKDNKQSLKREFKIKELGIFGSYVRGEQKKNSDIDILVAFSQTPGLFDYIRIENRLSKILHKKVDLVMKGTLKPTIGKQIMKEVIYV